MLRRTTTFSLLLLLTILLVAPQELLADQQAVLKVVPKQTLALALVNNPQATSKKISKIAELIQAPLPADSWNMAKGFTGFENGIADDGATAIAAIPGVDGMPIPLMIFPLADKDKFVAQLKEVEGSTYLSAKFGDQTMLVDIRGDHAFIVREQDEKFLGVIAKSESGLGSEIEPVESVITSSDIVIIATSDGVREGVSLGQEGLSMMREQLQGLGETEAEQLNAGFKFYDELFKWAKENVTVVAVGINIKDEGTVRMKAVAGLQATPGSKPTKVEASAEELLSLFPSQPYVMATAGPVPGKGLVKWMDYAFEMASSLPEFKSLTKKQRKEIMAMSRGSMKDLQGFGMVWYVTEPEKPLYSGFGMVMKVKDAKAYMETTKQSTEALAEIAGDSPLGKSTVSAVKIAGRDALKVVSAIPKNEQAAEQTPQYEEIMKMMFGDGDELPVYYVPIDDQHIVASYVTPDLCEKIIAAAAKEGEDGIDQRADLVKTAEMLPKSKGWKMYLSPQGNVAFVASMAKAVLPAELRVDIPEFPDSPPIGVSFTLESDRFEKEVVIPAEFFKSIGVYVDKVRGGVTETSLQLQP